MINWIHAGPVVTAAFLASVVECVEAATIILAVGTVRGWRSALLGTAAGLAVLAALVVVLGPALGAIPLAVLQLVVGLLLLLFGLSWLRKAVRRAAGTLALHDEQVQIKGPPIHLAHLHVRTMNLLHCSAKRSVGGGSKSNA